MTSTSTSSASSPDPAAGASPVRGDTDPGPRPNDFSARAEMGRTARRRTPRSSNRQWNPDGRADPIGLLESQAASRVPELVPIRYGRMMVSPLTFFRGAALIMAADLANTPNSGLIVQLCGDAHLSNFGVFGTPERSLVFDVNDFDETLPGPWEWDVKRLAASFEIAGRQRAFAAADRRQITLAVGAGYRERMRAAAASGVLTSWYDRLKSEHIEQWIRAEREAHRATKRQVRAIDAGIAKARTKDSLTAFSKLVQSVDGEMRILADPPLIVPLEDLLPPGVDRRETERSMRDLLTSYQSTLPFAHHPVQEFTFRHMARKVVGVGSVGTRSWILLLTGRDDADPLLLQAKEAQPSVLERFLAPSDFDHHGERVVRGQRLMQAASDIFLGWQRVTGVDGQSRDFYIRQLHDWKGSVDVDVIREQGALAYARICGETLARAHARSGDRVAIAAYLGESDRFETAIADFAESYADQNSADYTAFVNAVSTGRLEAITEL